MKYEVKKAKANIEGIRNKIKDLQIEEVDSKA